MPRPIVIAYDGSPPSEEAIRRSADVVKQREALVVVVWEPGAPFDVVELPLGLDPAPIDVGPAIELEAQLAEAARRMAAKGAELARQAGFEAEGLAVADERNVAETLVHLADERDAAAIVVGAHGRKGLDRLLMGSTSEGVVRHATRPVVVVRTTQPQ